MEKLKETIAKFEAALPGQGPETADDAVIKTAGEMVRITYTASSRYHQDPATEGPMFPALSMAMGLTPENTEADFYLAVQTRFVRQRNRLVGQLRHIIEDCENLMCRWDMERQTS